MPEKVFVFHDVKGQDDCLVPLSVDHSVTQNSEYLIVRKVFRADNHLLSALQFLVNEVLVDEHDNVFWDHQRTTTT